MEKPVIIEFAGISCAGKSTAFSEIFKVPKPNDILCAESILNTYYKSLIKKILFLDISTPPPIVKAAFLSWVHLKNISRYKTFYVLCIKSILNGNHKLKALNSFYFKLGKFLLLKKLNKGIVLIDEGVIQLLFSLFVRSADNIDATEKTLKAIIESAPLPNEVIFGPVSPLNIITNRMIKRGHHRVTKGSHSKSALESRANKFTLQSIRLQTLIIIELKDRLTINTLSDFEDWDNVIDRFRHAEINETIHNPINSSLAV